LTDTPHSKRPPHRALTNRIQQQPQQQRKGENGGRADVQWAALRDPQTGAGLLLRCAAGPVPAARVKEAEAEAQALDASAGLSPIPGRFHFNASMHAMGELEAATHGNELNEWKDGAFLCG
jgi:hypothetical protein